MQYHTTGQDSTAWVSYWFEKNLQGDVVAVYGDDGTKYVSYTYDAWGNFTTQYYVDGSGDLGVYDNPFLYRGYYYDADLALYYLGTRYYDAFSGRFISPDHSFVITATPMGLTDKNLYAYCDNNPVMRVDGDGEFWVTLGAMAIGAVWGSVMSAISSAVTQKNFTGEVNWKSVGVAAASGFISGAVAASPLGKVGQVIVSGVIGGLSYAADCYVNDKAMRLDEALVSVFASAFSGLIGGAGANEKMVLSNAAKSAKQTIARATRRTNQKYAQKVISKAISTRNDTFSNAFWTTSFRFAAGLATSNGITGVWGFAAKLLDNVPSLKPW